MSIGSLILGLLGAVGAALVWRPTGKDAPADWPPRATGTVPDVAPEPAAAGAPRFSVVVPTYNRGPLVVEAIESVLAQRAGDFELIVVDDGSTDGTAEAVPPDDRISLLARSHSGNVAALRNAGMARARGTAVTGLDLQPVTGLGQEVKKKK